MRRVYQSRRDALLAGLARHCTPHLTVHNADAGLHVAAMLAPGLDDRAVVLRMRDRGLTATALSSSYAERAKRSGLLLGFGGSTERRITDATRMLGEVLRTASSRTAVGQLFAIVSELSVGEGDGRCSPAHRGYEPSVRTQRANSAR
jgi:GntR family transcriptional regulator/MocR family aminotransferase